MKMKKQRLTKAFLLALLLCACVFVSPPVSAVEYYPSTFPDSYNTTHYYGESVTSFSHDASTEGNKIALVYFTLPSNSRIDFTLYYGSSSSVSGYLTTVQLTGLDIGRSKATVSMGGTTHDYTYFDVNQFYDIDVAGYAKSDNATVNTGFLVSSDQYGLFDNDLAVFYPVSPIQQNLMYKIDATGTQPFTIEVIDGDPQDVGEGATHSVWQTAEGWIDFAIGLGSSLFGFVTGLLSLLKFFFIDNLFLTIALYISVSMAYSAVYSRNIFEFYKKFFKFQRTMFEFIISIWRALVEIIATFRGIFRI